MINFAESESQFSHLKKSAVGNVNNKAGFIWFRVTPGTSPVKKHSQTEEFEFLCELNNQNVFHV